MRHLSAAIRLFELNEHPNFTPKSHLVRDVINVITCRFRGLLPLFNVIQLYQRYYRGKPARIRSINVIRPRLTLIKQKPAKSGLVRGRFCMFLFFHLILNQPHN